MIKRSNWAADKVSLLNSLRVVVDKFSLLLPLQQLLNALETDREVCRLEAKGIRSSMDRGISIVATSVITYMPLFTSDSIYTVIFNPTSLDIQLIWACMINNTTRKCPDTYQQFGKRYCWKKKKRHYQWPSLSLWLGAISPLIEQSDFPPLHEHF